MPGALRLSGLPAEKDSPSKNLEKLLQDQTLSKEKKRYIEAMLAENKDLKNQLSIKDNIREKDSKLLQDEVLRLVAQNARSEQIAEHATGKAKGYKFRLTGKASLDLAEKMFMPLWLRNSDLKRAQKWAVCLRFGLTGLAQDLLYKLSRNQTTNRLTPAMIGKFVERLYTELAKTFTDEMGMVVPTTDSEWKYVFKALKLYAQKDTLVLRTILERTYGFEDDLYSSLIPMEPQYDPRSGYVLIKNVNRKANAKAITTYLATKGVIVRQIEIFRDSISLTAPDVHHFMVYVQDVDVIDFIGQLVGFKDLATDLYHIFPWEIVFSVLHNAQ